MITLAPAAAAVAADPESAAEKGEEGADVCSQLTLFYCYLCIVAVFVFHLTKVPPAVAVRDGGNSGGDVLPDRLTGRTRPRSPARSDSGDENETDCGLESGGDRHVGDELKGGGWPVEAAAAANAANGWGR